MTQMQQFDGTEHITMYHEPERTSIAAILGLVCSCIGCCGGVTAIIGVFLSIFGIVGISRSKGRIGGMGFAIAGLLVGILMLALWGGMFGGAVYVGKQFDTAVVQPTFGALQAIESDNYDAARAVLAPPASDATDEELAAFRDQYLAILGPVAATPDGLFDHIGKTIELIETLAPFQGANNMIPVPMQFENDMAMVAILFDQKQANSGAPIPTEIVIIDRKGNIISLPDGLYESSGGSTDPVTSDGVEIEDFSDDAPDPTDTDPDEGP